ncbi:MAG: sensor histidine kinase [Dethiobacteria bacterium]|nr:GHKL domain-containing protein [Bacillota bacterium]
MQKKTENIEKVMAKSYDLYKSMKEQKINKELQQLALQVAGEIHEIKKDSVRILAGLSKILKVRSDRDMYLSEILELVIKTNRNYSHSLKKDIQFHLSINNDLSVSEIYPLLAIFNNIVSNAIEAIIKKGKVIISADCIEDGKKMLVSVCDDGQPINKKDRELIFEPGYTTKFSADGAPSTGIGLAYVKGLVEDFKGRVWVEFEKNRNVFIYCCPQTLCKEETIKNELFFLCN